MKPKKFEEHLLSGYGDGELDEEALREVEAHLEKSPEDREVLEQIKWLAKRSAEVAMPSVSEEEWGRCWAEVEDAMALGGEEALLSGYLDGELDGEKGREVEVWLADSEIARDRLEDMKRFREKTPEIDLPSISEKEWNRCFQNIELAAAETDRPSRESSSNIIYIGWALAAGLAACVLIYFTWDYNRQEESVDPGKHIAKDKDHEDPEKVIFVSPRTTDDNQSELEFIQTSEGYTSTVDVALTEGGMVVININANQTEDKSQSSPSKNK